MFITSELFNCDKMPITCAPRLLEILQNVDQNVSKGLEKKALIFIYFLKFSFDIVYGVGLLIEIIAAGGQKNITFRKRTEPQKMHSVIAR